MSMQAFKKVVVGSAVTAAMLAGSGSVGWAQSPRTRAQEVVSKQPTQVVPQLTDPEAVQNVGANSPATILGNQFVPIDLGSALALAGVENPEILEARQRITEAVALRQLAAAQFLPNINVGSNLDTHTGTLQQSPGRIITTKRTALYVGMGAQAIAAGTVNIPGVSWNMNVGQAYYAALVSRQVVAQREAAAQATNNEKLLQTAVAYIDLHRAEATRAIAITVRAEASEVARLTYAYWQTGQGRKADADRAATELARRQAEVIETETEVLTASARLCQLLNLDPSTRLHAADAYIIPMPLIPEPVTLPELVAISMMRRPELAERRAAIQAAMLELSGAKMLPFSPNAIIGLSAGEFGGGSNLINNPLPPVYAPGTPAQPQFGDFAPRSDIDVVLYWTLQNMGVGNRAIINAASSRLRQQNLREVVVLNQVRKEVAEAYARTHAKYAQIGTTEEAVKTGSEAFDADLIRIKGREGLPIEVLDSLRLMGRAKMEYMNSIAEYNQAQIRLYVALGQPPANTLSRDAGAMAEPGVEAPPPAPPAQ
jgi:outer membrane protein TolC